MSLADDVQANLPYLRSEAEGRMVDECEVGEFGEGDPDPVTGQPTLVLVAEHYSGRCRVKSASNVSSESSAGGQSFATQQLILSVPVADAGAIRTDDVLRITEVDPTTGNPAMLNRIFRIAGLASVSQATAARFSLELIS